MCKRIDCSKCGKPTFAGCGQHIEQVLGDVPKEQRCSCSAQSAQSTKAASAGGAAPSSGGGLFSRLFGK